MYVQNVIIMGLANTSTLVQIVDLLRLMIKEYYGECRITVLPVVFCGFFIK